MKRTYRVVLAAAEPGHYHEFSFRGTLAEAQEAGRERAKETGPGWELLGVLAGGEWQS